MLVLFETSAGYALFKVLDEGKLQNVKDIQQAFSNENNAKKMVSLKAFVKFDDTTDALAAASAIVESKISKKLKKFLKKSIINKELKDSLAVYDAKLGSLIKDKLNIPCIHDSSILELMRGIKSQISTLLGGVSDSDMSKMALGLSHTLSRYKLKFTPDKVDTMIVQAIGLLDDLDKELNTYSMRVKEWYGWHFPELAKIINDNILYAKTILLMRTRSNTNNTDFSSILPEEMESQIKDASIISMGTEISEEDVDNISMLCSEIVAINDYRAQLFEYLKNRMLAIAPNLTTMVGEMVGARLISRAGSLINLAKFPASTVQILGAEKALFRALKTKHDTPKYGLIYHASLIGQAPAKFKGKVARILATKCSLSARVDALGDKDTVTIGIEAKTKVESRLRELEGGTLHQMSGTSKGKSKQKAYDPERSKSATISKEAPKQYNAANDVVMADESKKDKKKKEKKDKRKRDNEEETPAAAVEEAPAAEEPVAEEPKKEKKKKDKKKKETVQEEAAEETTETAPKKSRKEAVETTEENGDGASKKKDKKKKKEKN